MLLLFELPEVKGGTNGMHIGSHVSTRGSYEGAARTAALMDAGAFQYFPKNPRSLVTKTNWNPHDTEGCAAYSKEQGLLSIGHSPYPLNLAVDKEERGIMLESLRNALAITEECGSVGLVVHFGKYRGKDPLQGYKNIIQLLNEVLREWHGNALVLLENQAGEGNGMGTTLEELIQVRSLSEVPDRIGFCFDTCHAFASGIWSESEWKRFEAKGEELGYFRELKAVHLNDSLYPFGSRRDRHANIGQGHIGLDAFRLLLASTYLQEIPVVMETEPAEDGHRAEIALVKALADQPL
jgi:deoxyribonuclease-4